MKVCVSKKLVWLGLAVLFTLTLASGANAQPGEFVKGVLQPLADEFPKRPITIVVVDDPGRAIRSTPGCCRNVSQLILKCQ